MKVEVDVLGSPSLTVLMVSVDVKQHWKKKLGWGGEGGWGGGGWGGMMAICYLPVPQGCRTLTDSPSSKALWSREVRILEGLSENYHLGHNYRYVYPMRYREQDWEAAFRFLHASAMTTSTTIPVFGLLAVLSVVVDRFGSFLKE